MKTKNIIYLTSLLVGTNLIKQNDSLIKKKRDINSDDVFSSFDLFPYPLKEFCIGKVISQGKAFQALDYPVKYNGISISKGSCFIETVHNLQVGFEHNICVESSYDNKIIYEGRMLAISNKYLVLQDEDFVLKSNILDKIDTPFILVNIKERIDCFCYFESYIDKLVTINFNNYFEDEFNNFKIYQLGDRSNIRIPDSTNEERDIYLKIISSPYPKSSNGIIKIDKTLNGIKKKYRDNVELQINKSCLELISDIGYQDFGNRLVNQICFKYIDFEFDNVIVFKIKGIKYGPYYVNNLFDLYQETPFLIPNTCKIRVTRNKSKNSEIGIFSLYSPDYIQYFSIYSKNLFIDNLKFNLTDIDPLKLIFNTFNKTDLDLGNPFYFLPSPDGFSFPNLNFNSNLNQITEILNDTSQDLYRNTFNFNFFEINNLKKPEEFINIRSDENLSINLQVKSAPLDYFQKTEGVRTKLNSLNLINSTLILYNENISGLKKIFFKIDSYDSKSNTILYIKSKSSKGEVIWFNRIRDLNESELNYEVLVGEDEETRQNHISTLISAKNDDILELVGITSSNLVLTKLEYFY